MRSTVSVSIAMAASCGAIAMAQVPPSTTPPVAPLAAAPGDADVEAARRYFEAGVASMARQNFAEAVNAFESSYRLRRTASVALNLGVSLFRLSRFVEARTRLQEFVETATPTQHAAHDAEVGRLIGEIGRRVARVQIAEIVPANAVVSIDGRPAVLNASNESVVDPGEHVVRATAAGMHPFEQRVRVADGAVASVRAVLRPSGVATIDPRVGVSPPGSAGSGPITSRWWFWTAIGAVAVGATVGIVAATTGGGTDPVPGGNTGRVLQGLSIPGGLAW